MGYAIAMIPHHRGFLPDGEKWSENQLGHAEEPSKIQDQ